MRLSVVCGDSILREGLQSLLGTISGIQVALSNGTIEATQILARSGAIEGTVVVPEGLSGADMEALIHTKQVHGVKVVALSALGMPTTRLEASIADAVAYRDNGAQGLRRALAMLSRRPLHATAPAVIAPVSAPIAPRRRAIRLTRREEDVASLVAQGKSNRQIADDLGLREQSVKNLVSMIMRKLNCENRVQLALQFNAQPTKIAG